MGNNSRYDVATDIIPHLSLEPQSIKEITEQSTRNRKTVTAWLETLEDAGLLRSKEVGRQRLFWIDLRSFITGNPEEPAE